MKYRTMGKTGLRVSELGFGCGAVGGLLVRGAYPDMVRVVGRAIERGITYFDTASSYGDGKSEINLGRVLRELGADVVVGTKVRLTPADMDHIAEAVVASVEASLSRLQRDGVDLIQLHNSVGSRRQPEQGWITLQDAAIVMETFEKLREQGKTRFWGMNGTGETAVLHQAVDAGMAHTMQIPYNLLNPSAGRPVPAGFPFQDYQQLIERAAAQQMGVIAIRILAAGALSGSLERHPVAAQSVAPIASGRRFEEDVALARCFDFLVQDGYVDTLVEAAIRFAISNPSISTALVGVSNLDQLEQAVDAVERGPLPAEALDRLPTIWSSFATLDLDKIDAKKES